MPEELRDNGWHLEKTFEIGNAIVEVNRFDSYHPRFSMRIGWKQGSRVGAWFPFGDEHRTYADDICEAVELAETYILDQTELRLNVIAKEIQAQHERAVDKREQHEDGIDRRAEEREEKKRAVEKPVVVKPAPIRSTPKRREKND